MRVTAGQYRSRLLGAPPGTETRPTADRLREALFNILSSRLSQRGGFAGLRVADLYAGTGALGIEALSRGAAHCYFAETAAPALKSLRANLRSLGIGPADVSVQERGTAPLLRELARTGERLDLVLLDPPYADEAAYLSTLRDLPPVLAADALVMAESAARAAPLPEASGPLRLLTRRVYGSSALHLYAFTAER